MNDAYLEYLLVIARKAEYMKNTQHQSSKAIKDVKPYFDKLCTKAVSKVRQFLLQQINELKKPKTNTQIIKQQVFLKYKYFNEFLRVHNKDVAQEIRAHYVDTMGKIYYLSFKNYVMNLQKLEQKMATKSDVIVEKENFSLFGSSTMISKITAFQLGERAKILEEIHKAVPIVAHLALEKQVRYPFEQLFLR